MKLLISCFAVVSLTAKAEVLPPVAKKIEHIDNFHNDPRVDFYRWMHDSESKEVISHLEDENKYAKQKLEQHKSLIGNIKSELKSYRIPKTKRLFDVDSEYSYYYISTDKDNFSSLVRKNKATGAEELILDENEESKQFEYFSASSPEISPSRSRFLFTVDTLGRSLYKPMLIDMNSGKKKYLKSNVFWGSYSWLNDTEVLLLGREDELGGTHLYRYNTVTEKIETVKKFETSDGQRSIYDNQDKDILVITESFSTKTISHTYEISTGKLSLIDEGEEGVKNFFTYSNEGVYKRTNKSNTNYDIQFKSYGTDSWETVLTGEEELSSLSLLEDKILVGSSIEGNNYLNFLHAGELKRIQLKSSLSSTYFTAFDKSEGQLYFSNEGYTEPESTYTCSLDDCVPKKLNLVKVPNINTSLYESKRIYIKARDGVNIPTTLIYRKDLVKESGNRVLLYGYGAYRNTISPVFSTSIIPATNRGVVYAYAHIRGGGINGQDWYDSGRYFKKMNTFYDFIDVADHLVNTGFTSRDKMAIKGESAGGLLMGTVLNLRPDLAKSVHLGVPFLDVLNTMTLYNDPLAKYEKKEWGDGLVEEEYEMIKSYDPYTNVKTFNSLPSILVTTGFQDSAVYYFQPMKWVAKMREYNPNHKKLIFTTEFKGGHGGASGADSFESSIAKEYGFLLGELGISK